MIFPTLLSNSQVAERLGITRQNMPNKRKTKGFPEPVLTVDKFPMWLAEDIERYAAEREAKKQKSPQP